VIVFGAFSEFISDRNCCSLFSDSCIVLQDFEVPLRPLDASELNHIQDKIASFIMSQIIPKKAKFHYDVVV
jgi:hypothetical protein